MDVDPATFSTTQGSRITLSLTNLQWSDDGLTPPPFYALDGRLMVDIDGKSFFDALILPLELDEQLARWQALIKSYILQTFTYTSIEYDEGPLLVFQQLAPTTWTLVSPWEEHPAPKDLSLQHLIDLTQTFHAVLSQELAERYQR